MGVQTKRYQGGSIVTFIIVTIALAALLIGGVSWLRHRGNVARLQKTDTALQADKGDESDAKQQAQSGDKEDAAAQEGAAQQNTDKKDVDKKNDFPAETAAGAAAGSSDKKSDDKKADKKQDAAASAQQGSGATTTVAQASANLPQTGSADAAIAVIAVGAMTYAAASYVTSRGRLARHDVSL